MLGTGENQIQPSSTVVLFPTLLPVSKPFLTDWLLFPAHAPYFCAHSTPSRVCFGAVCEKNRAVEMLCKVLPLLCWWLHHKQPFFGCHLHLLKRTSDHLFALFGGQRHATVMGHFHPCAAFFLLVRDVRMSFASAYLGNLLSLLRGLQKSRGLLPLRTVRPLCCRLLFLSCAHLPRTFRGRLGRQRWLCC